MLEQEASIFSLFRIVISLILIDESFSQKKTTTENSQELTDPTLDLDSLLDLDGGYGAYTPQNFAYVNFQHRYVHDPYFAEHDQVTVTTRCSVDHIKCLSNLEVPMPICGFIFPYYHWYIRYKVFESYCHLYLENCLFFHLRYRMLNYGGCYMHKHQNPERWLFPHENPIH